MEILCFVAGSVWKMGVSVSLLIGAVLAVRCCFLHRLPKRTFPVLWMICIFRALIPEVPHSPVNIQVLLSKIESQAFVRNASHISEAGETMLEGMYLWMTEGTGGLHGATAATTGGTPVAGIAAVIWLVGFVVLSAYVLTIYVKYRRFFSESLPLKEVLDWESGLARKVRLRRSDRISAPLSYGLIRPVILFPASMDWTDEAAVSMILAHETIHIRRFDGLLKGALALCLCVHWYHPLVWLMVSLGSRDMELACDEAVVQEASWDLRRDYALTLIRMEERRGAGGVLYSHFSENAIEERIAAIMKIKKTTGLALICALCLVIGLTAVFATEAPNREAEELIWPVDGCQQITMTFGERTHPVTGETKVFDHITIGDSQGNAEGATVWASSGGIVTEAEYRSDLGYYLVIDHGDGFVTKYTHCGELLVGVDQEVQQREPIASVGKTGLVTGPCLGFYVYRDGQAVDPVLYLE